MGNHKTDIQGVGIPAIVMQSIASVMTFGLNQILISYTATARGSDKSAKIRVLSSMPVFGLNNGMIPITDTIWGREDLSAYEEPSITAWDMPQPSWRQALCCPRFLRWNNGNV